MLLGKSLWLLIISNFEEFFSWERLSVINVCRKRMKRERNLDESYVEVDEK